MIPIVWSTKIPLVADEDGQLYYSTKDMKEKTWCDVTKDGLPYNWDNIDEKIYTKYLEDKGIPIEIEIEHETIQTIKEYIMTKPSGQSTKSPITVENVYQMANIVLNKSIEKTDEYNHVRNSHCQRYSKTPNSRMKYESRKAEIYEFNEYERDEVFDELAWKRYIDDTYLEDMFNEQNDSDFDDTDVCSDLDDRYDDDYDRREDYRWGYGPWDEYNDDYY